MLDSLMAQTTFSDSLVLAGLIDSLRGYILIILGFSLVIFVHELGHFLAAKWCDVRVKQFAIGFGKELFGFTMGETRYSLNMLPFGGYVKMLGQEDFEIDKSEEWKVKDDPRSFIHKSVGARMLIVSAGVIMNLVFAAAIFMLVFMIGLDAIPAQVGRVIVGSPADQSGLQIGDQIVQVNDNAIADYNDLKVAVMLADPDMPLDVTYKRNMGGDQQPKQKTVHLRPERNPEANMLMIGVEAPMSNEVAVVLPDSNLPPGEQLREGDEIVAVNGQAVTDFYQIMPLIVIGKGDYAELTVKRGGANASAGAPATQPTTATVKRRANLVFHSTGKALEENGHLLGLVPRRRVLQIGPDTPAGKGGLTDGDVIVRWGNQTAPTIDEILDSIKANPGKNISVTVLRREAGNEPREVQLDIKPRLSGLLQTGEPTVGIDPRMYLQETDRPVVADIVTEVNEEIKTPTAGLKEVMPRGATITRVNDTPVGNWYELADAFVAAAGHKATLAWRYGEQPEETAEIYIPNTLGTTFDLPADAEIISIDGQEKVEVQRKGRRRIFTVDHWYGARNVLKDKVGQTVEVAYRGYNEPEETVVQVEVTPEMLDTWVQRIEYVVLDFQADYVRTVLQESNPLDAMMIGLRKTVYFVKMVYITGKRMIFNRSLGFENVSGPVGILQQGSTIAQHDFVILLYFLAMISANLAVINFLPLPIVDGGLFVFLIIEKIKGSPISMGVQVATQIIGLILIAGVFLFVTFQDVQRIFG